MSPSGGQVETEVLNSKTRGTLCFLFSPSDGEIILTKYQENKAGIPFLLLAKGNGMTYCTYCNE